MELRQLEYFVAVAEEANFTRAAARVHVAQPGVSAQIRRLERELGQDLLDRSGRGVRLTKVGAAVLPYARAALAAVAGARSAVDELTGLVRGRVAVGMVTACSAPEMLDLLAGFHRRHPAVEINLSEGSSDELIAALLEGRLDAAFIGLGPRPRDDIEVRLVGDEPLVAAVASGDPLAARESVPLRALADRPLISLPAGTGLRAWLDEACAAAGIHPRIAFEASDPRVLAQLAGRGLGVAIVPESLARNYAAEVKTVHLTRAGMRGRLAFAWRREGPSSPAARALIDYSDDPPG